MLVHAYFAVAESLPPWYLGSLGISMLELSHVASEIRNRNVLSWASPLLSEDQQGYYGGVDQDMC